MQKRIKLNKPLDYYGMPLFEEPVEDRRAHEHRPVIFSRVWAMPNHATFKIPAIKRLLDRHMKPDRSRGFYKVGEDWADPFCGDNSPAWRKNDHNPDKGGPAAKHMEALDFVQELKRIYKARGKPHDKLEGVLFDPPYSFRQISEHYKLLGKKATKKDTSMAFYEKVKSELADLVRPGGKAISLGWNSNGFGITRGFRIVEILMVAHGGSRNDTIVVVEEKV